MLNYKSKYLKYKKKYLDLLGGYKNEAFHSIQNRETSGYATKLVKGHGSITGGQTFILPEGCNVITLTDADLSIHALSVYDAIIKFYLSKNYELFENNNRSYKKLESCKKLEDALNLFTKIIPGNTDIFNIRNHVGPLKINEMRFNFTEEPCNIGNCSIDLYNPIYKVLAPIRENVRLNWLINRKQNTEIIQKSEVTDTYYLSELIEKEGSGTYIIRSCRNILPNIPPVVKLAKQTSAEVPKSE